MKSTVGQTFLSVLSLSVRLILLLEEGQARMPVLHSLRYRNSERGQRCSQLSPRNVGCDNQHCSFGLVLFSDYAMTVVEEVESPRECKRVFRKIRGLG